jgi:hypothetical protein
MQSASLPYEPLDVHNLEDDDAVKVAPSEKPNYDTTDPVSSVSKVDDLRD